MNETSYLCRQCGHIFRVPSEPETDIKCPQCGSDSVRVLPHWSPAGSGLSQGAPTWECECQNCRARFEIPAPADPSAARNIRCRACHGEHIHRLTPAGYEPLYCG